MAEILSGTGRQQPDISMTADPYTGVEIIYSYNDPGNYSVSVIGGTSASCPMFSGSVGHRQPEEPAGPWQAGRFGRAVPVHHASRSNQGREAEFPVLWHKPDRCHHASRWTRLFRVGSRHRDA